jgi:hypothetical protein
MFLKTQRIKAQKWVLFLLLLSPFHGINGHAKRRTMTDFSYLLFNQSPEQLRRIGARGGKAQARNRRARLLTHYEAQPCGAVLHPMPEHPLPLTATQAIAALDAQFPWLCGAEKRRAPRRPQRN